MLCFLHNKQHRGMSYLIDAVDDWVTEGDFLFLLLGLGTDVEVLNVAENVILGAVNGTMLVSVVHVGVGATFFFFFGSPLSFLQL